MEAKIFFVILVLIVVFWFVTLPGRKRRQGEAGDRNRRKAHNSRMIHYKGFRTSITPEGHRRVHAKERYGPHSCSDQCPWCAAGVEYQSQLRVFDDRPIRGRRDRRAMRDEYE